MHFLERDVALSELESALDMGLRGGGRIALISGEAGIGKSTLVDHFVRRRSEVRSLWGTCDAMFTPRPLGPLIDIATQLDGSLRAALTANGARASIQAIFDATLAELQRVPTIAVFEDVHWADEGTLDLLRFLGRRVARTSALVVLTFRDDELGAAHPLRTLLGDLATVPAVLRLPLPPLSEAAVRKLVGEGSIDPAELHCRTGGNPFFVKEILADPNTDLPRTIRDAVLGRIARLSPQAQSVLEVAAVIGPRIEPWLLQRIAVDGGHAANECLSSGMLSAHGDVLTFRHELVRQAVLDAVAPLRRVLLHRLALEQLRAANDRSATDITRLVHHAEGANDCQTLRAYAPEAARAASAAGAHRAAAALLTKSLPCNADQPLADRAALLELLSAEYTHIADFDRAIGAQRQALDLWRAAGHVLKEGESLALLASVLTAAGQRSEARTVSPMSIALLETLRPGRELAYAYRMRASLHLANHELRDAIDVAERALALAVQAGSERDQVRAWEILGGAWLHIEQRRGAEYFERAHSAAQRLGSFPDVARGYANYGSALAEVFDFAAAERRLGEGLAVTAERDLDRLRLYMLGWLAITHVFRGRWADAALAANEVLNARSASGNARFAARVALGRVQARQAGVTIPEPLEVALQMALSWGEVTSIAMVRAALAEAAWLAGDIARTRTEADAALALAVDKGHRWLAGELAFWRWRSGCLDTPPAWIPQPFALQIAGDWRAAARAWAELGCSYEQARALADGDAVAQEEALAIFDGLGARPAAAAVRRRLRTQGVTRVRRGPRATTRTNPFGLTQRELEILCLITEGLSNAEIGGRLSIAPKTAEHHVAAVLTKLDVPSRHAAVSVARTHRLLPQK